MMAFQYTSLSGTRLNPDEEQLLEKIDCFSYQLKGYLNLADLHSTITVELSDKKNNKRSFSYVITDKERHDIIKRLIQEIWKTYSKLFPKIIKELNCGVESIDPIVIDGDLRQGIGRLSDEEIQRRQRLIEILYPFVGKIEEIRQKIRDLEALENEIRPSGQFNNDDYYNIDLELSRLNDLYGLMDHIRKRIDEIVQEIEEIGRIINRSSEERWYPENKLPSRIKPIVDELQEEIKRLRGLLDIYLNASKEPNGDYRISGDNELLGEYVSSQKKVILYYKTIKKYEPIISKQRKLLATVYVHEMMHAYLDYGFVKAYFEKIEEPIAEYAMLSFFNAFDKTILQYSEKHVEAKQNTMGIAHYGFGYYLFKNLKEVDWLDDYYNAKPHLVSTGPNIGNYLDFWRDGRYPFDMEQFCMVMLYLTLQRSYAIVDAIQRIMTTKMHVGSGMKIGLYARQTLTDLLRSKKLTPADISNLEDSIFCRNMLGMSYPVLVDVSKNTPIRNKYYSPDRSIHPYVICNDWRDKNRSRFDTWLSTI